MWAILPARGGEDGSRKWGARSYTSAQGRRNDSNEANDRRPNALDLNPTARRRLDGTTSQSPSTQAARPGNQSETCCGITRAGVRIARRSGGERLASPRVTKEGRSRVVKDRMARAQWFRTGRWVGGSVVRYRGVCGPSGTGSIARAVEEVCGSMGPVGREQGPPGMRLPSSPAEVSEPAPSRLRTDSRSPCLLLHAGRACKRFVGMGQDRMEQE